jgi:Glycosyl transferase family 2
MMEKLNSTPALNHGTHLARGSLQGFIGSAASLPTGLITAALLTRWLGVYWVIRLLLMMLLVHQYPTVKAAISANIGAAVLTLALARHFMKPSLLAYSDFPLKQLWVYAWPLFCYTIGMNLFRQIDLLMVTAICKNPSLAGYYGATKNLTIIPGLEALGRMDYPTRCLEVLVVDDGNDPSSRHGIESISDNVRFFDCSHRGASATRNHGASNAKGELLVFTDENSVPPLDWLKQITQRHHPNTERVICGRVHDMHPENIYSRAGQAFWDYLTAHFNSRHDRPRSLNSAYMAIPLRFFEAQGGFDEQLIRLEDRNLCEQTRKAGIPMIFVPEISVAHAHPTGFGTLWLQHLSWGKAAHHLRFGSTPHDGRPGFESISFYFKLIMGPLLAAPGPNSAIISALLAISQTATVWGFSLAWISNRFSEKS